METPPTIEGASPTHIRRINRDGSVRAEMRAVAREIGMVPIELHK